MSRPRMEQESYGLSNVKQLEEENVVLRNKLLDAAEENFNLQASMATIEAEAKFNAAQELVGLQSELSFKKSEIEQQRYEVSKLSKEVQELRQKIASQKTPEITGSSSNLKLQNQSNNDEVDNSIYQLKKNESQNSNENYSASMNIKKSIDDNHSSALLSFLPKIHRSVNDLLISCSINSPKESPVIISPSFILSPSSSFPRTPNSNGLLTSCGFSHFTNVASSWRNKFESHHISPINPLIDEIEHMSISFTQASIKDKSISQTQEPPQYNPQNLLQCLSTVLKTIVTIVLPFSTFKVSSSNSFNHHLHNLPNNSSTPTSLPAPALLHILHVICVTFEEFPWSHMTISQILLEQENAQQNTSKQAIPGNKLSSHDKENEDDDMLLMSTNAAARVRSNLSQRFDRMKRGSNSQTDSHLTHVNTLIGIVDKIAEGKMSSSSTTDLYVSIIANALRRVHVRDPNSSNNNKNNDNNNNNNASKSNTSKLTPLISDACKTNTQTVKRLTLVEAGQWVESLLETLQDLTARHIILLESDFEYLHGNFSPQLSTALLQVMSAVGEFLQAHCQEYETNATHEINHSGQNKIMILTSDIHRYWVTLFEKMTISRVRYHQSLFHHVHALSSVTIKNRSNISLALGGSQHISSRQFSLLSTSSMASLILPFIRMNSQDTDKAKNACIRRFLKVLQWSLQDERVFDVFFKQQCQLTRQLYRFTAFSEIQETYNTNSDKDKKSDNQHIPVIVWLVQELCSLQDIFVAKTDVNASVNISDKSIKHQQTGSSTKNTVSTLQDSFEDPLMGEDPTISTITHTKTTTTQDASDDNSTKNNNDFRFEMLKQPLQLQLSPLQSKLEILRWLLSLARTWPHCFVTLLLQIVPPQLSSLSAISTSSTTSMDEKNRTNNMDVDVADTGYNSIGKVVNGKKQLMNEDDEEEYEEEEDSVRGDGLARSMMTGVVAHHQVTTNNSVCTSASSSEMTTIMGRHSNNKRKKRGKKSRLQILDDILEENDKEKKEDVQEIIRTSERVNKNKKNAAQEIKMDVDEEVEADNITSNMRNGLEQANSNSNHNNNEGFYWGNFLLTSLQFELSTPSGSDSSSSSIPLFISTPVVHGHPSVDNQTSTSYKSSNRSLTPTIQKIEALSGIITLATSHFSNDKRSSTAVSGTSSFDTVCLVAICQVWMQLWQWCDLYVAEKGDHNSMDMSLQTKFPRSQEEENAIDMLLEATRVCTRLFNVVVGALLDHPQQRLILRDCSAILTSFFFRDILNNMHPALQLSSSDYEHLDALEE